MTHVESRISLASPVDFSTGDLDPIDASFDPPRDLDTVAAVDGQYRHWRGHRRRRLRLRRSG